MLKLLPLLLLMIALLMQSAEGAKRRKTKFVTVTLEEGNRIRGRAHYTLYENKRYISFKGIPYAEAPIGHLRFRPPIHKHMPDKLNALNYSKTCIQPVKYSIEPENEDEDCLYLNVHTPAIRPPEKFAVIVFIHSGAYSLGASNDLFTGADFLIEKNVILVSFNYRLNVFGFMSLGNARYSGNMGLKDQRLALQWVRQNIHQFGGDPNRVTLLGSSAGSSAVHLHVLSGSSNNFQRSILMSGTAATVWAISPIVNHRRRMMAFAEKHNASISTFADLKDWLVKAPARLLQTMVDKLDNSIRPEESWNYAWAPVVQDETADQPFVIHEKALDDNYRSNKDMLIGQTNQERLSIMGDILHNHELLENIDKNFRIALPFQQWNLCRQAKFVAKLVPERQRAIADLFKHILGDVRHFYFGNATIDRSTFVRLTTMLTDIVFTISVGHTVEHQIGHSTGRTYYYRMSADTRLNFVKVLTNTTEVGGAAHSDDLCYIFRCYIFSDLYDFAPNSTERRVQTNLLNLFTNFVKHGSPTPSGIPIDFKPVTATDRHLLNIGNNLLRIIQNPYKKNIEFWDNLYLKYSANITENC